MKKLFTFFAVIAAACLAFSCNDMEEFEERMDNLESRVQALETICTALNNNVLALQEFTEANKSISKVEESDGKYVLTLSDGSKIEISQGSEGTAVMPDIAIDADGYWTVNGEQVISNGQPVPATGEDGATPIFGVDADGYWTVKYSAEETSTQVLDENGAPVKAIPDGQTPGGSSDQFFDDVQVLEDCVEVTIDGQKYSLPIIPDFMCAINTDGTEPIMFNLSETKTFAVEQKNVAAATIFAPQGWEATLEETILTVIAPATVTKATADTRQDVSILAISKTGFAAISKIRVQLSDAPIIITPTAAVTAGEATDKTLSFTVALSNATTWYYMLKKSSETAPTAEEMKAATAGSETELTLSTDSAGAALEPETEYTLYVLPVNGETEGEIAKATKATAEKQYATLYERFMDKGSITIAGRTYSKSDYTEENIKVIEANEEFNAANNSIYFVNGTATITGMANNNVVIIGEDHANMPVFNMSGSKYLTPISGEATRLVLHNVKIDASALTNYMFTVNANYSDKGAFGEFVLSNCNIITGTGPFYSISNARYLDIFIMENCDVRILPATTNRFIIHTDKFQAEFTEITFRNNIFYCADASGAEGSAEGFRLVSGNTSTNETTVDTITAENNTFVNTIPSNSSMIVLNSVTSVTIKNNLFYIDKTQANNRCCLYTLSGIYPAKADRDCNNNIVYDSANNTATFNMYYAAKNITDYDITTELPTVITENPLSVRDYNSGIFTPVSTYASYGAQR